MVEKINERDNLQIDTDMAMACDAQLALQKYQFDSTSEAQFEAAAGKVDEQSDKITVSPNETKEHQVRRIADTFYKLAAKAAASMTVEGEAAEDVILIEDEQEESATILDGDENPKDEADVDETETTTHDVTLGVNDSVVIQSKTTDDVSR